MNATIRDDSSPRFSSKYKSNGALPLIKWLVLIALLVLLVLALFLPDRGLAALNGDDHADHHLLAGALSNAVGALSPRNKAPQLSSMRRPTASSTPSEKRIRTWFPSISKGTAMRASSW